MELWRDPSPDVLFWRISLGTIGILAAMLVPEMLVPEYIRGFPWMLFGIIILGIAFVVGGMLGRYRDRRAQRPKLRRRFGRRGVQTAGMMLLVLGIGGGLAANFVEYVPTSVLVGLAILDVVGGLLLWATWRFRAQALSNPS